MPCCFQFWLISCLYLSLYMLGQGFYSQVIIMLFDFTIANVGKSAVVANLTIVVTSQKNVSFDQLTNFSWWFCKCVFEVNFFANEIYNAVLLYYRAFDLIDPGLYVCPIYKWVVLDPDGIDITNSHISTQLRLRKTQNEICIFGV